MNGSLAVGVETGTGAVPMAATGVTKGALPVALPRADPRVRGARLALTVPIVRARVHAAGVPHFLFVGAGPHIHAGIAAGPLAAVVADHVGVCEAAGPRAGPVGGVTAGPRAHFATRVDDPGGHPRVHEGVHVGGHVLLRDEQFPGLSSFEICAVDAGVGIGVTGGPIDAERRVVGALLGAFLPIVATRAMPGGGGTFVKNVVQLVGILSGSLQHLLVVLIAPEIFFGIHSRGQEKDRKYRNT